MLPLKCLLRLPGAQLRISLVIYNVSEAVTGGRNVNGLQGVKTVTKRTSEHVQAHKLLRSEQAFAAVHISTLPLKGLLSWESEADLPEVLRVPLESEYILERLPAQSDTSVDQCDFGFATDRKGGRLQRRWDERRRCKACAA